MGYFQEEFYRLKIRDNYVKYVILAKKWPTEDVFQLLKIIGQNFETFCDFCVNRDNSLSKIFSKVPQYAASTPFGVFLADGIN